MVIGTTCAPAFGSVSSLRWCGLPLMAGRQLRQAFQPPLTRLPFESDHSILVSLTWARGLVPLSSTKHPLVRTDPKLLTCPSSNLRILKPYTCRSLPHYRPSLDREQPLIATMTRSFFFLLGLLTYAISLLNYSSATSVPATYDSVDLSLTETTPYSLAKRSTSSKSTKTSAGGVAEEIINFMQVIMEGGIQ
jgi:hypothetical protein